MRSARAAVLGAALAALAAPAIAAEAAPLFVAYPSYSAKFDIGSGKFSLVTNVVIYNISGQNFTEVTFKQVYPDGVTVKETYQREVFKQVYPDGVTVKETYQREVGTEATGEQSSARKVENNVFYASMPAFKPRQWVAIFNELDLARRLTTITFPGVEISYTDPQGAKQTTRLQDNSYDLFIYSNVVGGLERFLRKYNNIDFDFGKAVPDRKEWEFAPISASAQGKLPTGIVGTFPGSNQYDGYFRLRSGPPGDNIQIVVVYKNIPKQEKIADKDALQKQLREYLRWCGEFEMIPDSLKISQGEWKKYKEAWSLEGRWRDTIKNRLGEGVLKAHVFYGPREDVEYYVLGLAQGRGLGPEASNTPAPDKEAKLAAEIDRLFDTFKSEIVPLSYEKRR